MRALELVKQATENLYRTRKDLKPDEPVFWQGRGLYELDEHQKIQELELKSKERKDLDDLDPLFLASLDDVHIGMEENKRTTTTTTTTTTMTTTTSSSTNNIISSSNQEWTCTACTYANEPKRTLCSVCGSRRFMVSSEPWICNINNCETTNSFDRNYCSKCDKRKQIT